VGLLEHDEAGRAEAAGEEVSRPVPFTQYLRPSGRAAHYSVTRSHEIGTKAHALLDQGVVFESELLNTDEVSLTAEKDGNVLSIVVIPNGPGVGKAVDELIEEAHKWMAQHTGRASPDGET
jgi:hypothetical protein